MIVSLVLAAACGLLLLAYLRRARDLARAEKIVKVRERLLAELRVGVYELVDSPKGQRRIDFINERTLMLLGVTRQDVESDFYAAFRNVHPDDAGRIIEANDRARHEATPFQVTMRMMVDGGVRWLRVESWPRQEADGVHWAGSVTDVTEQKDAEVKFRAIFDQAPMSIVINDAESLEIIEANEATWRSYGLEPGSALRVEELFDEPPYSMNDMMPAIDRARAGETQRLRWRSRDRNGRVFWEDVVIVPVQIGGRNCLFSVSIDMTELVGNEMALAEAEARFRSIFEEAPLSLILHDAHTGEFLDTNPAGWQAYGAASLQELKAREHELWEAAPYDQQSAIARVRSVHREGRQQFDWKSRRLDGTSFWEQVTLTPLRVGGRDCVLSAAIDITLRREAEALLKESDERFRTLLKEVPDVAIQGYGLDGTVNYWNRASEALYGYTEEEALGANLLDLIIPPEMRALVRANISGVARGGVIENGEMELMHKDGSHVLVYSSHAVVRRSGIPVEMFCVDIDLSERKRHEDELVRIASYDALTGLPNRNLLAELMREHCARADRSGEGFALCYLDLDQFKPINDQFGHAVGDRVLVEIADRLRHTVRGSDVVGRLGGDEFLLLLSGLSEGSELDRRLSEILACIKSYETKAS